MHAECWSSKEWGHNRTNNLQEINVWEVRNLVTSLVRICIPVVWKPVYIFLHWPSIVPQIVLFAKYLIKGWWLVWLMIHLFVVSDTILLWGQMTVLVNICMWKVKNLMPNKLQVIDILSILWITVSKMTSSQSRFFKSLNDHLDTAFTVHVWITMKRCL